MVDKVSFDDPHGFGDVELGDRSTQEDNVISSVLKKSSHPYVCIFHFAFKISCLLIYIFGNWFGYIGTFILVVLLLAFDFWTVKNISGRLLVGTILNFKIEKILFKIDIDIKFIILFCVY